MDGSSVPVELTVSPLRDPEEAIAGYLGIAYDISERKRAEAHMRYIAFHDPLTGLPNRALLNERIDEALEATRRRGGKLGILLIELDQFKRVNDTFGHQAGDQILVVVAGIIHGCLRETDMLARFGGDEFVVLLPELIDVSDAIDSARRILLALTGPDGRGGHLASITASIGIAAFPDHGADRTELLKHADFAMYGARRRGRNHHLVFTRAMADELERRLDLERALSHAVDGGEFHIEYQPEVSAAAGCVIAVEALLRWRHPKLGLVLPDEFIPIAEDTGMIVPIGEWVLRNACAEIAAINRQLGLAVRLSVNVSPRQLRSQQLFAEIEDALRANGMEPELLEIEVTEVSLMEEGGEEFELLTRLRNLGVIVTIDDFGKGYSSLSYLANFPVDRIKIDKAFVRDLGIDRNREAIVSAILAMGHQLGIQVACEGVESIRQFEWLAGRDCSEFQGFLFARPVCAGDLGEVISRVEEHLTGLPKPPARTEGSMPAAGATPQTTAVTPPST